MRYIIKKKRKKNGIFSFTARVDDYLTLEKSAGEDAFRIHLILPLSTSSAFRSRKKKKRKEKKKEETVVWRFYKINCTR